ncbi:MAG: FHA domain-containing protein [Planctomycetota bacterium]|nr:MAG: FHA domain-containing protein [Planctomycetota bacterium]
MVATGARSRVSVTLFLEEGGRLRKLSFDQATIRVGRTADNEVKVGDALSSRHHCQLRREGDHYVVEDLGSRNGTRLNGLPLTEAHRLVPGDRIAIGESVLHFGKPPGGATRRTTSRGKRPRLPARADREGFLRVLAGKEKGARHPLRDFPLSIGRKTSCSLVVADDDVSGEHCMIVADGGLLHAVDLGSTNGTFLDGVRIKGRAPLCYGQQIRLGATLTFAVEGAKAKARRAARKRPREVEAVAVDEVRDLDDLDEETAVADAPAPRGEDDDAETRAQAVVAQEGDVTDVAFGEDLEAEAARLAQRGGAGALVVALGVTCAVLAAAVVASARVLAREEGDPSPAENRLDNWSFERVAGARLPGWELVADEAEVLARGARYGRRALRLVVGPDTRPEVRSANPVRVEGGRPYRVRAAAKLGAGVAAALRVDWQRDDGSPVGSTYPAVADPDATLEKSWRTLAGVARAPHGATQAQVAVLALARGGAGEALFDRVSFTPADEAVEAEKTLPGPAGLEIRSSARGVLSLRRSGRLEPLAVDLGLCLVPGDPLTWQAAARLDQPAELQANRSLLALGTVPAAALGAPVEYSFSAGAAGDGLGLRWQLGKGASGEEVSLQLVVPKPAAVAPLELDGERIDLGSLPREGLSARGVREMAWGSGKSQVSFSFGSPARVQLATRERGLRLLLTFRPRKLDNGVFEVGIDLLAASLRARETLRRLLAEAEEARAAGDFPRALAAYERVLSEFAHDEGAALQARRGRSLLEEEARRRLGFLRWARSRADELPLPPLQRAAESVCEELRSGFPGSAHARRGEQDLEAVRRAVATHRRREAAQEIRSLLDRAKAARSAGHVRIARAYYRAILARFAPDLEGVVEAKNRLAALPSLEEDSR